MCQTAVIYRVSACPKWLFVDENTFLDSFNYVSIENKAHLFLISNDTLIKFNFPIIFIQLVKDYVI